MAILDSHKLIYEELPSAKKMSLRRFRQIKRAIELRGSKYRTFKEIREIFKISSNGFRAVKNAEDFEDYFNKRKQYSKPKIYGDKK